MKNRWHASFPIWHGQQAKVRKNKNPKGFVFLDITSIPSNKAAVRYAGFTLHCYARVRHKMSKTRKDVSPRIRTTEHTCARPTQVRTYWKNVCFFASAVSGFNIFQDLRHFFVFVFLFFFFFLFFSQTTYHFWLSVGMSYSKSRDTLCIFSLFRILFYRVLCARMGAINLTKYPSGGIPHDTRADQLPIERISALLYSG